ncbi:hypothetical protein H5T51_07760 [Candidatus Bathyarchaeota archaeon]|nr:hypothetical protein [Candidatus Bathyarchaeota archaeon]
MFDISTVGHFCIDSIILPNRKKPCTILGGSVTYTSLAAARLGASVSIISKVGSDFPKAYLWWLDQEGVDLRAVTILDDFETTRFELKYNEELSSRSLRLLSRAKPITVDDIPQHLLARVFHIAPVANEVSYEVVEKLRKRADFLSLDAQGLVRVFRKSGEAFLATPEDKRILNFVDIYKSSEDEIKAITETHDLKAAVKAVHSFGVETVIVTLGEEGVLLSVDGTSYNVPSYKPSRLVDPTGAGDAFMGGFLTEYIHDGDSYWCACVGCAAASMVVEDVGPINLGSRDEIYRRARILYEKGV